MAKTLGRFNYLTVKKDNFDVIFKPIFSGFSVTIAQNLDYQSAMELMSNLNEVIDDFRRMHLGISNEEEGSNVG